MFTQSVQVGFSRGISYARSASKRREKQAAPRAQEAVQLQVRQLELKQLESEPQREQLFGFIIFWCFNDSMTCLNVKSLFFE